MKKKLLKNTLKDIELMVIGALPVVDSQDKHLARLFDRIDYLSSLVRDEGEYSPLKDALNQKFGGDLFTKN